ncbi:MAG: HEAT repeat domain-containing protein [Candidatus Choladocola sp.]|nr:HEAT repeat domain-containing protein [Candidatus Choladocola sp.]
MIKEYYEKICDGEDVRANLIALRQSLKEENNRRAFAYLLGGEFEKLCELLQHEDPKVRKNAALILGQMESEDLLPVLFDTYKTEKTKFVRVDYLKAMSEMDYERLVPRLEKELEVLRGTEFSQEEWKHVSEEIRMLQNMIMKYRSKGHHRFTGYHVVTDMVLVTNRCQREATARQIRNGRLTMLAGGIKVREAQVGDLLPIRTYSELLFPLETPVLPVHSPEETGQAAAEGIMKKALELHQGGAPFLFRIELKSRIAPERKGAYIRKISDAIEKASGGDLINSVSDYELELRLMERKDGTFAPMLKLFSLPDRRFAYRKETVASSIHPCNAALTVELAKPYLKEGAQILDPFCGVGTMLIERSRALTTGPMYGIDIYGDAIEKARDNTERAGCRVYYINKDFFEFEHEYLFDEIITDMPQVTASRAKKEIRQLYLDFFARAGKHLKKDGVMVLYATEPQFVQDSLSLYGDYRLENKYTINEKNGTCVFAIRWCGSPGRDQ